MARAGMLVPLFM